MAMIDVKVIGRWSHDINLGHTSRWEQQDIDILLSNGCRISKAQYIMAPAEVLEGVMPFRMRGDADLTLNKTIKLNLVKGKRSLSRKSHTTEVSQCQ